MLTTPRCRRATSSRAYPAAVGGAQRVAGSGIPRRARTLALLALAAACTAPDPADSSASEPVSSSAPMLAEQPPVARSRIPCRIESVIDGDTIRCAGGRRVRLLLIDAPEMDQGTYGRRSREALRALVPPGTVASLELDVERQDRYRRTLAYVYLPDGRMANELLVARGFAVVSVYPPNVRYVDRFRAAADRARKAKRGLWSGSAFECLPADHRRKRC